MTNIPVTEAPTKIPEWDMVEDITMKEITEYGLDILPYFFDDATANRLGMAYVYVGSRGTK